MNATATSPIVETQAFLELRYGQALRGFITVCDGVPGMDKAKLPCTTFPVTAIRQAAEHIVRKSSTRHVWIGAGLQASIPREGSRGCAETCCGIPGLWADIDVAHPVHKKSGMLPPDINAAMDLIDDVGLIPTEIIATGHGLQAWWLFKEPWMFADATELKNAQKLSEDFKETLAHHAAKRKWKLDAVADFARLMRPPGSKNHKDVLNVLDVQVYSAAHECRYTVDDIRAILIEPAKPEPKNKTRAESNGDDLDDFDLIAKARSAGNGAKFNRLWNGDNGDHGGDASAGDLALCNMLAFWTRKDANRIDNLFRQSKRMRDKWTKRHASNGETYGAMTINKAIAQCRDIYEPRQRENGDSYESHFGGDHQEQNKPKPAEVIEPIPLERPQAPEMPAGMFGGWIDQMIEAVSAANETPRELAAMMTLTALSTVCQQRFSVRVEHDYFEPLCSFIASVFDPGTRKTSVQSRLMQPIRAWEKRQAAEFQVKIKEAESNRKTQEGRIKQLRAKAERTDDKTEYAALRDEISGLENSLPEVPFVPRLTAEDITPEHTATVLSRNSERIAIISDEGGIFENFAGRYSGGVGNLDLLLKGHSSSSGKVDRGSRPPIILDHPTITVGVSIQPDVLRGMFRKDGFRGRGLMARFWFVLPKSNLGYRELRTQAIPEDVGTSYDDAITALADIPPRMDGDREIPYVLKLAGDAHWAWKQFAKEIEVMMRPGGRLEYLKDWGGKAPGAAVRIAGLLHCGLYASCAATVLEIEGDTMQRAVEMVRFLLEHAICAFGSMTADDGFEQAERIWAVVDRLRKDTVTARELWHPLRGLLIGYSPRARSADNRRALFMRHTRRALGV